LHRPVFGEVDPVVDSSAGGIRQYLWPQIICISRRTFPSEGVWLPVERNCRRW